MMIPLQCPIPPLASNLMVCLTVPKIETPEWKMLARRRDNLAKGEITRRLEELGYPMVLPISRVQSHFSESCHASMLPEPGSPRAKRDAPYWGP